MYRNNLPINYQQNNRVGFLGPFLLGGLVGGLSAPYFYGSGYYPNQYYNYYYPYPYYGNYYR